MTPLADIDAERAVLGSMMLEQKAALVALEFGLQSEHFADRRCRLAFAAAIDLTLSGRPIDAVQLRAVLSDWGDLDAVGGLSGILDLGSTVATAANVRHYAERVRDKARIRAVVDRAQRLIADAPCAADPDAFLREEITAIAEAAASTRTGAPIEDAEVWTRGVLEELEREHADNKEPGLTTGFRVYDRAGGLRPGFLYLAAGRPGSGKTAWMLNLALAAAESGRRVFVVSLEMTRRELVERLIAMRSTMKASTLGSARRLSADDWEHVYGGLRSLSKLPLTMWCPANVSFDQVRAAALQLNTMRRIDLLAVDYLQLVRTAGVHREQEVSAISRGLKLLAKELACPVLALCQLNRKVEERRPPIPVASDLRDSGGLEQDADHIAMLYRPHEYDESADPEAAEVIVTKDRHGPRGVAKMRFIAAHQRFED